MEIDRRRGGIETPFAATKRAADFDGIRCLEVQSIGREHWPRKGSRNRLKLAASAGDEPRLRSTMRQYRKNPSFKRRVEKIADSQSDKLFNKDAKQSKDEMSSLPIV